MNRKHDPRIPKLTPHQLRWLKWILARLPNDHLAMLRTLRKRITHARERKTVEMLGQLEKRQLLVRIDGVWYPSPLIDLMIDDGILKPVIPVSSMCASNDLR